MISESNNFECITPCFCAGADPARAEIRAPSIRGELRWWFRALGGTREQEVSVFGGSQPKPTASSIRCRVGEHQLQRLAALPSFDQNNPISYVLHFAKVSGKSSGSSGPRWQTEGCAAPGTKFPLEVMQIRGLQDESAAMLNRSLAAFKAFGSIGLRITRGLGALQAAEVSDAVRSETIRMLQDTGFVVVPLGEFRDSTRTGAKAWELCAKETGRFLKEELRALYKAKPHNHSALGLSDPRQTSAIRLRPVRLDSGALQLYALEAPHERTLGAKSRKAHSSSRSLLKEVGLA